MPEGRGDEGREALRREKRPGFAVLPNGQGRPHVSVAATDFGVTFASKRYRAEGIPKGQRYDTGNHHKGRRLPQSPS